MPSQIASTDSISTYRRGIVGRIRNSSRLAIGNGVRNVCEGQDGGLRGGKSSEGADEDGASEHYGGIGKEYG